MPKKIEVVEMPDSLAFSEHTENVNKVANRQWRKWNNQARYIFNEVFSQLEMMQSVQHPGMPKMSVEHWQTIRWNAAWTAADSAMATVKDGPDLNDVTKSVFVPMLQALYTKADLKIPKQIHPGTEVRRLVKAFREQA